MLKFFFFNLPITLGRKRVEARRNYFFETILDVCSRPPDAAAILMGQDAYDVPANPTTASVDPEKGLLVFHVDAMFDGVNCHHTYSLYQIGDLFKIGLLLRDGLEQAPNLDLHRELKDIWPGTPYAQIDREDYTLFEWTFRVPHLYRSWIDQETFAYGMRHCKMRILRIIRDYITLKNSAA